ncbi:MAG TPA: CGNR zinc finger domain-containing protein, partial [Candidatus Limnocylindrales bacterium]
HGVDVPEGQPARSDLAALTAIREVVRDLATGGAGWTPAARALMDRATFRLDADGVLAAEGDGWRRFIGNLLPPLVELARVNGRVSTCANPACRLVFLDASKSGTRRWCDDGGCGNRIRLRRHRERLPRTS